MGLSSFSCPQCSPFIDNFNEYILARKRTKIPFARAKFSFRAFESLSLADLSRMSSSLKLQKRLSASILQCGKSKVWMDPNEINEIAMANSSAYIYFFN